VRSSPHFLDWDNKPLPYKIYPGAAVDFFTARSESFLDAGAGALSSYVPADFSARSKRPR